MFPRQFQLPAHHALSRKRRSNSTRGNNRRVLFKTEHRVSYSGVEEVHLSSHYMNADPSRGDGAYNTVEHAPSVPAPVIHHHHHHGTPSMEEHSGVTDYFGLGPYESLRGSFNPSPLYAGDLPQDQGNEFDPFFPLHFDSFDDPGVSDSKDLPLQDTPESHSQPLPSVTPSPFMPVVGHPGLFYKLPAPSKVEQLVQAAPFQDVVVASLPEAVAPLRVVVPAPSAILPPAVVLASPPAVVLPSPAGRPIPFENPPAATATPPVRWPTPHENQPAVAGQVQNQTHSENHPAGPAVIVVSSPPIGPVQYQQLPELHPAIVLAAPGSASENHQVVAAPVQNQPEVAVPVQPDVLIVHDDDLETQGFVYEEPSQSYWKEKGRLDELGVFSHERWKQMRCIHFILPNMTDNGQATTPKTARVPHFQTSLSEIKRQVASFTASGGNIELKIYQPDQDYSNKFLHVVNSGLAQIQAVDWEQLAEIAYQENAADEKRQHKFKDIGTTGGQCTTRVHSSVGVAKPGKKPGSSAPSIVEAMVALSDYTKNAKFEWMPDGLRPFNYDDRNDPRNKFARRIHNDCCIPAGRIGLTNVENPCGYHCDELNSQLLQYECVPTFNKIVYLHGERFRCALIGYSRRSVDEYLVRADVHGRYVDFVCSEYELFDDKRKHISSDLFSLSLPVKGCIPKFPVEHSPCNMDPWGHYSSVIESTLQLERKFKLNLPERMSLLRAMAVTPNSTYLFVAAATALLEQEDDIDPQHREDFRFGLLVANLMVDIHRSLINQKRSLPPRRFNCYATYRVPDELEWNQQCEKLLILSLTTPDSKQTKSERRTAYRQIRRDLSDVLPYVDVLGGNHLVAIAGTLGLLPFWVTNEIEVHKGRPIEWLLAKFFEDKKQRSKIKVDDMIANVGAALKTRYGGEFTVRTVENIICKVFRRHTFNRSDERFHDIHAHGQHLYYVTRTHVCIVADDGSSTICVKGCLLPKIPFGGTYLTAAELQQELPAKWPGWDPTIKTLGARSLKGLFDKRRGEYPANDFHLKEPMGRNKWLSNQFLITEQRLL